MYIYIFWNSAMMFTVWIRLFSSLISNEFNWTDQYRQQCMKWKWLLNCAKNKINVPFVVIFWYTFLNHNDVQLSYTYASRSSSLQICYVTGPNLAENSNHSVTTIVKDFKLIIIIIIIITSLLKASDKITYLMLQ